MKKGLLFATLALFTVSLVHSASLTLIQPNGGELCLGQQNYQIKWTAVGINEKIKLVLFRNNDNIGIIAKDLDPGSSPYLWTVGQHDNGTAPAGEGYKIRIRTMSNGTDDFSDSSFWLKTESPPCPSLPPPAGTVKLVSPGGGESWVLGSEHAINWTSTNLAGKVQLELVRYQDRTLGVIKDNLPASGSHTWKAGEYPGNTAPAGKYLVRVRSMDKHAIFDESDSFFNLGPLHLEIPKSKKASVTLPAIVLNWAGTAVFPNISTPPLSIFQGRPDCNALNNTLAHVGVEWFLLGTYPAYPQAAAARIYRSRIHFNLNQFAGQGGKLLEAKLKLKQVGSVRTNTNDVSCASSLSLLLAPWTSFNNLQIDLIGGLPESQTEYSKDITAFVKKWLDGSLANHGLLLIASELPIGGQYWTCFSCFEASLVLKFE